MNNQTFTGDDGIYMTSFRKKEVTGLPINNQIGDVPSYSEVVFGTQDHKVDIEYDKTLTISSPYANMSKEDVLRFSNTPFWKTTRMIALITFWLIWLAFLVTVIALIITTPRCDPVPVKEWYEKGIFYDIYVRSFHDSDDDGVGDLKGIEKKVDLLKEMGVDALVLSSFLKSHDSINEKNDFGYEVIDYKDVDLSLGTVEDFKSLLNHTHKNDMKVIMDWVPNYTGLEHPWFESFKTANQNQEHWNSYISANQIPNNWMNKWDGGVQAWRALVGLEFFYTQFLKTQPELNLRSNLVREELEKSMKFWLDLGVDGFRIVNSDFLIENSDLKDNDKVLVHNKYQDDSIDLINNWKNLLTNYPGSVLITDGDSKRVDFTERYYKRVCHVRQYLSINYDLMSITTQNKNGEALVDSLENFISSIPDGSIALWTTGNQDTSRLESRSGVNMTRSLTLLKMTLPGSALVYYGEEIEMVDNELVENLEKDPVVDVGGSYKVGRSRYRSRQPMHWNNSTNAGFSHSALPWLNIDPEVNILTMNVEYEKRRSDSVWVLMTKLSALRHKHLSLQHGKIHFGYRDRDLVTYVREHEGDDRLLVVVNLSDSSSEVADVTRKYSIHIPETANILITTDGRRGPYHNDMEVNLKRVASLPSGYGFVAHWKYERSL